MGLLVSFGLSCSWWWLEFPCRPQIAGPSVDVHFADREACLARLVLMIAPPPSRNRDAYRLVGAWEWV